MSSASLNRYLVRAGTEKEMDAVCVAIAQRPDLLKSVGSVQRQRAASLSPQFAALQEKIKADNRPGGFIGKLYKLAGA